MNRLTILSPGQPGEPTYIDWYDMACLAASHPIPYVENFMAIRLTGASGTDLETGESSLLPARKPAMTALRQAAMLGDFFESEVIGAADWALCEITRPAGWPNISIFAPIRLGTFSGRAFLKGVPSLRGSIRSCTELTITTGPCLFSGSTLRAVTNGGACIDILQPKVPISQPIQDIIVDPNLSLYELECAVRLTSVVSGLLSVVPEAIRVSVTLDVPRVQYYFYLLDAYSRGLVQKAQLLRWFDFVDRRHKAVVADMRTRLAQSPGRAGYLIRPASNMESLEILIREHLEAKALPSVQEMAALLSAEDSIWHMVLASQAVDTYLQLANLSYTVEQLRAGQWRGNGSTQRLGIAVENYNERLTFGRTMRIARELHRLDGDFRVSLLGMYPAEAIFTSRDRGATDLYCQDIGKQFIDRHSRRSYTASELISEAYGLDV